MPCFLRVKLVCFLVLAAVALSVVSGGPAASVYSQSPRPNVVMIISDDQKYSDFGFMGNDRVSTPNIDHLARQSARYTHGYVPSSVCRPSLVTLLTGLYPHQHGVHFNHPPPGFAKLTRSPEIGKREFDRLREQGAALIRPLPTLPRILASHGYRCFQTGKYWEGHWRNAGFTEGMTTAQPSGNEYGDKQLPSGDWVAHGNGDHGLAIGRQTMQPIEDFLDDVAQQPFFLWYAPFLPHTPHDAPARYVQPLAASGKVAPHELPYFASIAHFDDTVGRLVNSIERRGLASKTLFVFVVDNGWEPDADRFREATGEWDHTKKSKRAPFDAGLRTPLLFRWSGHTRAATHTELVSSIDIVPTILSAIQIQPPSHELPTIELPGIDLWPSAIGQASLSKERSVFGELYPGDATVLGNPSVDLAYRWIRRREYKLIVPHHRDGKPPWNRYLTSPALYDVVADPAETKNLISDPAMATTVHELTTRLNRWWSPQ